MTTHNMHLALKAAHSKPARAKATATLMKLAHIRATLSKKYGIGNKAFTKKHLVQTIRQHNIPMTDIPVTLLHPLPATIRRAMMERKRANGHAEPNGKANGRGGNGHAPGGMGIPLDAIPERKTKYERTGLHTKKKGHPNAELIGKIIDTIANPKTNDKVAERLLAALDKLLV